MSQGKSKKVIAAGLLIMSLTMSCNSSLSPILAEVGKSFPEASDSAIQIVLTLINLTTLPMMLIEPLLEPKMTKRDIAVLGTILMLIGGFMPQFLNSQLWMLYAASVVIGAGLSLVVVVSSSLISDYFTGIDKSRRKCRRRDHCKRQRSLYGNGRLGKRIPCIPDLYSDHYYCTSDSAEGRGGSAGRKNKSRHFRKYGLLRSALPDHRYLCSYI